MIFMDAKQTYITNIYGQITQEHLMKSSITNDSSGGGSGGER